MPAVVLQHEISGGFRGRVGVCHYGSAAHQREAGQVVDIIAQIDHLSWVNLPFCNQFP